MQKIKRWVLRLMGYRLVPLGYERIEPGLMKKAWEYAPDHILWKAVVCKIEAYREQCFFAASKARNTMERDQFLGGAEWLGALQFDLHESAKIAVGQSVIGNQ